LRAEIPQALTMFLDDRRRSAFNKRVVFQFAFHCSDFAFDLRDFFVEPLTLGRFVPCRNRWKKVSERGDRDRNANLRFVLPIQPYFFGA
jgi:hypothetical protein